MIVFAGLYTIQEIFYYRERKSFLKTITPVTPACIFHECEVTKSFFTDFFHRMLGIILFLAVCFHFPKNIFYISINIFFKSREDCNISHASGIRTTYL